MHGACPTCCCCMAPPRSDDMLMLAQVLSSFVGNAIMIGDPCAYHVDADPTSFPAASPWVHNFGYYHNVGAAVLSRSRTSKQLQSLKHCPPHTCEELQCDSRCNKHGRCCKCSVSHSVNLVTEGGTCVDVEDSDCL